MSKTEVLEAGAQGVIKKHTVADLLPGAVYEIFAMMDWKAWLDEELSVARDNPNCAMSFGYELIFETQRLEEFLSSVAAAWNFLDTEWKRGRYSRLKLQQLDLDAKGQA